MRLDLRGSAELAGNRAAALAPGTDDEATIQRRLVNARRELEMSKLS